MEAVTDNIKINQFEIENVKRVKAVKVQPSRNGLTVIGGKNGQGKTSVLDSIAWALGGGAFKPSEAKREGSVTDPYLKVILSNGLVVERKGKNSDLKVTDPDGNKSGQSLLDEFIEALALDLPKFLNANDKEKANTLLKIIGVGERLTELEIQEKELYNRRREIGRIADQKKKFADEQDYYPDAPHEPVSAADLIKQQQDILARNGERQRWIDEYDHILDMISRTEEQIEKKNAELLDLREKLEGLEIQKSDAVKTPEELEMESTEELEEAIENIEETNRKVRVNIDKDRAEDEALQLAHQVEQLTGELEDVRKQKTELLKSADLPLPELSVEDGALVYKGQRWDNMSGSEQLIVATAIVRKLNPGMGFVLLDKLEQMDTDTLAEFGDWLEDEGLQAIATRVSTGEECEIIISDGYSYDQDGNRTTGQQEEKPVKTRRKTASKTDNSTGQTPKWKGEF